MKPFKKWALGFIGAVIVGAIGSGVWNSLLGPAIRWLGLSLLTVISLGVKSFKDDVYQTIAMQGTLAPAFSAFSLLSTATVYLLGALVGFATADLQLRIWAKKLLTEDAERLKPPLVLRLSPPRVMLAILVLLTVLAAWVAGSAARTEYIGRSALNFRQMLETDSPYLNEQQRFQYESRFAQIRTRQDYADILSQLDNIAEQHGQRVPRFEIW